MYDTINNINNYMPLLYHNKDTGRPPYQVNRFHTFIGTKAAYRVLRECWQTLLHGLAINPLVAAEFIRYHAAAGHPDFIRFRNRLPDDLHDVLAPSLKAIQKQIIDNMAFDGSALINVVEGHMQATGDGASVMTETSNAPTDDRHLLDHVSRISPLSPTKKMSVTAAVRNELVNEYTDNHEIYQSAFPGLFPLGVPSTQHGPFPKHVFKTLLGSYQNGYERSVAFVGLSGDAKMRRERSVASSLMVKSPRYFSAFEALVGDSAFHDKLATAVRNPAGETAIEIMKVVKPVFCLANKNVPWSRGERKAEAGRITAMTRRFGPPTMMVTVSPNATDEPLVVCLATGKLGSDWKPQEIWARVRNSHESTARSDGGSTGQLRDVLQRVHEGGSTAPFWSGIRPDGGAGPKGPQGRHFWALPGRARRH